MPTLYKIFVNATALTSGGGLVTLRQFLDNIQPKDDCFYYVFCSVNYLPSMYKKDNVKFIFPKYRKGVARLYWDYIGLKRWSVSNYTVPDLVISLQNTTIFFDKHTPQISYIMQSIPFVDKQWNVFNKRERILWFYQNIYPFFMGLNLGENHYVVTQAKWIKDKFSIKFNFPLERIFPIRPIVNISLNEEKQKFNMGEYNVFLPSSPFVYKNNVEVANALIYLKSINQDISKFKIFVTFENKDDVDLHNVIGLNNLENNFLFIGRLMYKEMLKYYNGCDLVIFPSYLETFGLPLLEAAAFGKPLVCANESYAKEVIGNYSGATLLDVNSPNKWGESILENFKTRKKYNKYTADFKESWGDFFKLIKDIINTKVKNV